MHMETHAVLFFSAYSCKVHELDQAKGLAVVEMGSVIETGLLVLKSEKFRYEILYCLDGQCTNLQSLMHDALPDGLKCC